MLALAWPIFWIAYLPVVLIEAIVAKRMLRLSAGRALKVSALANAASTLVGIPLAWVFMLVVEILGVGLSSLAPRSEVWSTILFPFQVAWLGPVEDPRIVFAAFAVLAVPFCAASIYFEFLVADKLLPECPSKQVKLWAVVANMSSYAVVTAVTGIYAFFFAQRAI